MSTLTVSTKQQHFGANPVEMRDTDHYQMEYVHDLVEKWDELIDWEARAKGENNFFVNELTKRGKRSVLDVATGTGYHSVTLLKAGFNVTSVDGSDTMLAKAFYNARQRGHILKTVHSDWRWLDKDVHGRYDSVICLGNSFTHLFDENDRRKALAEFYSALHHDGILIIDHRNYDTMIDHGFSSKHAYYYAGENIRVGPEYIDEGLARFRYEFPDNTVFHLNMFPLRTDYVRRLLREVGFQKITTYGDFHDTYKQNEPDFFVHIAEKTYRGKI
jgi:glycine/sarcosine N-methyltransferase